MISPIILAMEPPDFVSQPLQNLPKFSNFNEWNIIVHFLLKEICPITVPTQDSFYGRSVLSSIQ